MNENQTMHLRLFFDHTYIFWSPSATIFIVYSIKEWNKRLCVATNQSKIWVYKYYKILKSPDKYKEITTKVFFTESIKRYGTNSNTFNIFNIATHYFYIILQWILELLSTTFWSFYHELHQRVLQIYNIL